MMTSQPQPARRTEPESGYILIAVLFLVALLVLALAVAAPRVAKSIQRDRETELIHRGEQYKRAIKLYYRKFGAYPSSIDQLMNTNQIRFLRKRYTDPMTGKDDWKVIHFGQAHVKTLGLFGQPIANTGAAGSNITGTSGPGALGAGGLAGNAGNTLATSGASGSGFGSTSGAAGGTSGSMYAPTSTGGDSTAGSSSGSGSGTDSGSSGSGSAFGSSSGSAFGSSSSGSGFGSSSGSSGFGSGDGSSGSNFGGGPIVGIVIPSTKASLKEYKQQKHYNEWEFVYDPLEDQLQAGTLFGGANQNVNGTGSSTGFGSGAGGIGGAGGYGGAGGIGGGAGGFGGAGSSGGTGFGSTGSGAGPTSPQQ